MWAIMCVCHHVCHKQTRSCLSTGWMLNHCFAWVFGTVAVLVQGGGGVSAVLQSCTVALPEVQCATGGWTACLHPFSVQQKGPMAMSPKTFFLCTSVCAQGLKHASASHSGGSIDVALQTPWTVIYQGTASPQCSGTAVT